MINLGKTFDKHIRTPIGSFLGNPWAASHSPQEFVEAIDRLRQAGDSSSDELKKNYFKLLKFVGRNLEKLVASHAKIKVDLLAYPEIYAWLYFRNEQRLQEYKNIVDTDLGTILESHFKGLEFLCCVHYEFGVAQNHNKLWDLLNPDIGSHDKSRKHGVEALKQIVKGKGTWKTTFASICEKLSENKDTLIYVFYLGNVLLIRGCNYLNAGDKSTQAVAGGEKWDTKVALRFVNLIKQKLEQSTNDEIVQDTVRVGVEKDAVAYVLGKLRDFSDSTKEKLSKGYGIDCSAIITCLANLAKPEVGLTI